MNEFVIMLSSDIYDKYLEYLNSSSPSVFLWKRVDFISKPERRIFKSF